MSLKSIHMENERIEAVKQWLEPQSVRDIQVFLEFANFYQRFIQGFSRIAAPLTSMLKTSGSIESKTRLGEGGVGVGGSKAGREGSKLERSELHSSEFDSGEFDDSEVDGGKIDVDEVEKKVQKCKNLSKSKKAVGSDFLTSGARLVFTKLKQAFVKAPILYHFDPKRHIRIETDASGYAIGEVFSPLTLDNMGRWHPVAFFSQKMTLAETRYETHNGELLAIIEAFKT